MARTQKIKIINILLASLDGKIATHHQESTAQRRQLQLTNEDDFNHMRQLTAQCDAVLIGARTLHSEIGAFRVADLRKDHKEPHWFVMTKSGRVNVEHPFWKQKNISKSLFQFKGSASIFTFLNLLRSKKIKKIALLGGGELNGFFWEHNLVSELHLTLSPFIIGTQNSPNLIASTHPLHKKLQLIKIKRKKSFLFLHYKVMENCHSTPQLDSGIQSSVKS